MSGGVYSENKAIAINFYFLYALIVLVLQKIKNVNCFCVFFFKHRFHQVYLIKQSFNVRILRSFVSFKFIVIVNSSTEISFLHSSSSSLFRTYCTKLDDFIYLFSPLNKHYWNNNCRWRDGDAIRVIVDVTIAGTWKLRWWRWWSV